VVETRKALLEANRAIDGLLDRQNLLVEDVRFLLARCGSAGKCSFSGKRDTGASSNSIVAIAYGDLPIEEQVFPCDSDDLAACVLAFEKLPAHRKTKDAHEALFRATQFLNVKMRDEQAGKPAPQVGGAA